MNKEKKIESILNSLDGVERSAPKPFFYGRVESRLRSPGGIESIVRFISRPMVAIAAVMLIIIINAYAIFITNPDNPDNTTQATELASIDEYTQMNTTIFDIEKLNP